jgi:hypothetical protein
MGSYSPLKPGDERNLRGEEDPFVAEQVWEGRRKGDILFFEINSKLTLLEGDYCLLKADKAKFSSVGQQ